jgi:DNA polymerase-3 subunit beta
LSPQRSFNIEAHAIKFSIGTENLRNAVGVARRFANTTKGGIPILTTLLVCADAAGVSVSGHSLDSCITISCPAAVSAASAAALDAQRLDALLRAAEGVQIAVETSSKAATVRIGSRSVYKVPALMAADFPAVLAFTGKPVVFNVDSDTVLDLLRPSVAISNDVYVRPFLCGLFLHDDGGRLATAATDGRLLMASYSAIAGAHSLPSNGEVDHGIIVPTGALAELARMARRDDVEIMTDGRLLEVRAGGAVYRSKLIYGVFPDYRRVLPPASEITATVNVDRLIAALRRLVATGEKDRKKGHGPAVGISWSADSGGICVEDEYGAANDLVVAETVGECWVAVPVLQFLDLLSALPAAQVRISVQAGAPSAPVRIDIVDDATLVALQTPSSKRWRKQTPK